MTPHEIVFSAQAGHQLRALSRYLTLEASPLVAKRYLNRLTDFCHSLSRFPYRGLPRSEVLPGLRTITYGRSVTIAYLIDENTVVIMGIYTGGQDYLSALGKDR